MRIKLDENLPAELVDDITALGHDADSVESEGLAGQADPVVAVAARRGQCAAADPSRTSTRRAPPDRHGVLHPVALVTL
jgi:hypothetical protein